MLWSCILIGVRACYSFDGWPKIVWEDVLEASKEFGINLGGMGVGFGEVCVLAII